MRSTGRPDASAAGTAGGQGRVLLFRRREEPRGGPVETVEQAVTAGRVVAIHYVDREGAASLREVEPAGLVRGLDGWYLVGRCRLRGEGRAFRLDRVAAAWLVDGSGSEPLPVLADLEPDVPAGLGRAARGGAMTA